MYCMLTIYLVADDLSDRVDSDTHITTTTSKGGQSHSGSNNRLLAHIQVTNNTDGKDDVDDDIDLRVSLGKSPCTSLTYCLTISLSLCYR